MSSISFTIDEVQVPDSIDGPDAKDFLDLMDIRNEVEAEILGTDALSISPEAGLAYLGGTPERQRRHFAGREDGRMIGRALLTLPMASGASEARVHVDVLPDHRGRGVGTALLATLESEAVAIGRTVMQADPMHRPADGGARIESPTGFGDLPADEPGVRFLVRHGYALEQVSRISSLELADAAEPAQERLAAAQAYAGDDYRVVTWTGPTPKEWVEDFAVLKSSMSTDTPNAGLEVAPDPWDADRVVAHGLRQQSSGRLLVSAAAEHVPSGRLVAFTEIEVPPGDAPAAVQEDTLVLSSHRGHRLGMLIKAANLLHLMDVAPSATVMTTFNAEENRPMLDVNEAMGFRAIGHDSAWQKRVRGE